MNGQRALLAAFLVALAVITFAEVHDNHYLPRPRRYVGAGVVYGILGIIAPITSAGFAAALGWGMVVALVYQHYSGKTAEQATPDTVKD